jgi:hypothetical protein
MESSPTSGGDPTNPYGGQTGSLIPQCGNAPQFNSGASVPEGDGAFVYYARSCGATEGQFAVTDSEGQPVAFQLIELGDGSLLIRTDTALDPGVYTVTTPDGTSKLVTVTETAALPTALGSVSMQWTNCDVAFSLALDATFIPYVDLARVLISIDGESPVVLRDFGTLTANASGSVGLGFRACEFGCLRPGPHTLQVSAEIAGENGIFEAAAVNFNYEGCSGSGDGGGLSCAVAEKRVRAQHAPLGLALLVGGLGWRRRRRPGPSQGR